MTKKEFKLRLKAIERKHKIDIELCKTISATDIEELIKEYKGSNSSVPATMHQLNAARYVFPEKSLDQRIALVNDLNEYTQKYINAFSTEVFLKAENIAAGKNIESQKILEARREHHARALKAFE